MTLSVPPKALIRPNLAIISEDYPKIKTESVQNVTGAINFILALLNIKTPDLLDDVDAHDEQMSFVGMFIIKEFGFLTVPEIKEAFRMYASRKLPNVRVFRILDCVSVGEVLNAYTEYRREALATYSSQKAHVATLPDISETAKEQILLDGINHRYWQFVATGEIDNPCSHVFDTLFERGLIKPKPPKGKLHDYYSEKEKRALAIVKIRTRESIPTSANFKNIIKQLEKLDTTSSEVVIEAKRLILIDFFEAQKDKGLCAIFQTEKLAKQLIEKEDLFLENLQKTLQKWTEK